MPYINLSMFNVSDLIMIKKMFIVYLLINTKYGP